MLGPFKKLEAEVQKRIGKLFEAVDRMTPKFDDLGDKLDRLSDAMEENNKLRKKE